MSSPYSPIQGGLIPVRNAWYLLLYAWDKARWKGNTGWESEPSPKLLGLLARILVGATHDLLRRQLGRTHNGRRDAIRGVRGRIDFATSLKRVTFRKGAVHCDFSELSVDTLKNRILLATLHRLASDTNLLLAYERQQEDSLRQELRGLARMLAGVSLVPIGSGDFSRLQLGRNDRDYALPIAICGLVRRLEMPTQTKGDQALTALLSDEIKFHDLFERFVRNFYHLHLARYSVEQQTLTWYDELGCKFVPRMHTDITLVEKRPPWRRVIIDTKYSVRTLVERPHGTEKFKSENLYQIYAYLRTQEHLSEAHLCAEGMLLYPTTEREIDELMKVQGHRIRIATVNLAQDWDQIETRLLALVQ
jgi:5-methylcytosine-specific restriction enzyme subunit McrC